MGYCYGTLFTLLDFDDDICYDDDDDAIEDELRIERRSVSGE